MKIPIIGGAYEGRSKELNPQECVNLYPIVDRADAKNVTALFGTPGLSLEVDLPDNIGQQTGQVRGMLYHDPYLFVAIGQYFYRYSTGATGTSFGSIASSLTEFITNGDMELDANWNNYNSPTTNIRSNLRNHTSGGTYSRYFATTASYSGIQSDAFTTVTGTDYTVSFWVRPLNSNTTTARMMVTKGDGGPGISITRYITGLSFSEWTYCTFNFTETSGGASATVLLLSGTGTKTQNLYVDDVSVAETLETYGRIWLANNNTHVMGVAPGYGGWTVDFATLTLAAISDGDFPTPRGMCYLDGYFIITEDATNKWYISAINDPTNWDALDYASAESRADLLLACMSMQGQVALFGAEVCEFHAHTGVGDWPFQRVAVTEQGLGAEASLAKFNDVFFFLNDQGEIRIIENYRSSKISTDSIDYHVQGYSKTSDATGFIYQQEGHTFYQISFPTANKTWTYDITTGLWHERQSYMSEGGYGRHRADCFAQFGELPLVGDYENGKIYNIGMGYYEDDGETIRRRRTSPVLHNEQRRIFFHSLEIDFEGGTGENLVVNGSMENDDNWADVGTPTDNDRSTARSYTGSYSRRFTVNAADEGIQSDDYTTETGNDYTVSLRVYPVDTTTVTLVVRKGDDSGDLLDSDITGLTQGAWNLVTQTVTETAGGAGAYVKITGGAETSGSWYIDEVIVADDDNEPMAVLDWSNDGGNTWKSTHSKGMGKAGEYGKRTRWTRLGSGRNRVFRVTIEEPVEVVLIDGIIEASPGDN